MTACTACDNEIKRGETYVAHTRQTERVDRLGAIKVKDSEVTATYHPACAPQGGDKR